MVEVFNVKVFHPLLQKSPSLAAGEFPLAGELSAAATRIAAFATRTRHISILLKLGYDIW